MSKSSPPMGLDEPVLVEEEQLSVPDMPLDTPRLEQEEEQHESGSVEVRDQQGNVFTIPLDDVAAAGIDIDHMEEMTEEQMNVLLSLVGSRALDDDAGKITGVYELDDDDDPLTINILVDGSLRLVESNRVECFFSAEQLAEVNIDASKNLTDEEIKRLVHLAHTLQYDADKPDVKRRKLEPIAIPMRHPRQTFEEMPSNVSPAGPLSHRSTRTAPTTHGGMIGEAVEVRQADGTTHNATIRYSRPGGKFKVQYTDGRFEWTTMERIITKSIRLSDHQGYVGAPAPQPAPRVPPIRRVLPRSVNGEPEPNFCCPICDKKVYQKEPSFIVIRLPACDTCTREKILIVDEPNDENEIDESSLRPPINSPRPSIESPHPQIEHELPKEEKQDALSHSSSHRPEMIDVGCSTDDLFTFPS